MFPWLTNPLRSQKCCSDIVASLAHISSCICYWWERVKKWIENVICVTDGNFISGIILGAVLSVVFCILVLVIVIALFILRAR